MRSLVARERTVRATEHERPRSFPSRHEALATETLIDRRNNGREIRFLFSLALSLSLSLPLYPSLFLLQTFARRSTISHAPSLLPCSSHLRLFHPALGRFHRNVSTEGEGSSSRIEKNTESLRIDYRARSNLALSSHELRETRELVKLVKLARCTTVLVTSADNGATTRPGRPRTMPRFASLSTLSSRNGCRRLSDLPLNAESAHCTV